MRLTIPISPPGFSTDDLLTPFVELLPLPPEQYPRVIDRRTPSRGYYVTLGLILLLRGLTPGSAVYLVWYALFGRHLTGTKAYTLAGLAIWATLELLFAIWQWYLIHYVQMPSPASKLPLEIRHSLFHKVLHSGLTYTPARTPSSPFQEPRSPWSDTSSVKEPTGPTGAAARRRTARQGGDGSVGGNDVTVGDTSSAAGNARISVSDTMAEKIDHSNAEYTKVNTPISTLSESEPMEDAFGNPIRLHPDDKRAVEFRERMRTWFNHAPWSSLRRRNVEIWLSWSCFGLPLDAVLQHEEHAEALVKTIQYLEARTGMPLPEGYDPKVEVLRLTLDPVIAQSRPLAVYAWAELTNLWLRKVEYPSQGLHTYRDGEIEYLLRIPKGWTPEQGLTKRNAIPVVYLHGLGFGLLQNHLLIKHLVKSLPSHPLLIPLAPYTSQSMTHPRHLKPWTREEFVGAMKRICTRWGFWEEGEKGHEDLGGVSMMSHSNGSVCHGWILKDCPGMTRRNTFVDPVVFLLWEGDVCHSFCYRKPATSLELLLYYFIASEIGIANYIQRHFDWADNTLFFDQIPNATDPRKTAIFLGAHDIIIDAARTRKYLEEPLMTDGLTRGLHWDPNAGHGDGLMGEARDRVVMYTGTGSTRGWAGWVDSGRHKHSASAREWPGVLDPASGSGSNDEGA